MNTDSTLDLNQRHSLGIRIWHWAFFIVLTASLITVGLASTLFRTGNNITLVQDQLGKQGLVASRDQARVVAHEFNDKLWALHTWLGYVLCFFLISRVIIEVATPGEEKFRRRIKAALAFKALNARQQGEQQHYLLVKRSYLFFYAAIAIMAVTGLILAFEDISLFRAWRGPVKQLHGFIQYFIYGFVGLHLVGVIRADLGRYPGIVSGMIHGGKRRSQ